MSFPTTPEPIIIQAATLAKREASEVAVASTRTIITRLEERMAARKTNAKRVSGAAGLGSTAVSDILSGKNANPSVPHLKAIANELDCDLAYLVGDQDAPRTGSTINAPSMPVIGIVEAGAFREPSQFPVESEHQMVRVFAPLSAEFPKARHFAMEVRGTSMNAAKPTPITDGMMVLCIDFIEAKLELQSGEIYVIRRTNDGGQTYEFTVKRAVFFRDRIELRSESTDPSNSTITLPRVAEPDGATKIEAIGLVYAAYVSLERH